MDKMKNVHHFRWMILDALRHAGTVARRAQEASEGTEATLLFDAVADAIAKLPDEHPAFRALTTAAFRRMD